MKSLNKIEAERSAFNKAGYILLHLLRHIKIEDFMVEKDKELNIVFQKNNDFSYSKNEGANDDIIMCLRAGTLSEKYYCWRKCISFDPGISGDDLWHISRISYTGKNESVNFENHLKDLEYETENIILTHWSFVIILARRLLGKKYLPISEIYELWAKYNSNK